jgi:hypothetical protein
MSQSTVATATLSNLRYRLKNARHFEDVNIMVQNSSVRFILPEIGIKYTLTKHKLQQLISCHTIIRQYSETILETPMLHSPTR